MDRNVLAAAQQHLERRVLAFSQAGGVSEAALDVLNSTGNGLDGRSRWAEIALYAQLDAGGMNFPLPSLYAGVEAVMTAVNLFDDVEDGDCNPVVERRGAPIAINVASWLLVLGTELVAEADRSAGTALNSRHSLSDVLRTGLLTSGCGQHADLTGRDSSLDEALRTAEAKSASLVGMICEMGAIAGGADHDAAALMRDLGRHMGMSAQLANDVRDFASKNKGRLSSGSSAMAALNPDASQEEVDTARLVVITLALHHTREAMQAADLVGARRLKRLLTGWLNAGVAQDSSVAA